MSVFIYVAPEKAILKEFKSAKEALKFADDNPGNLPTSVKDFQVMKEHSEVFHVNEVTQLKVEFDKVEEVKTDEK
ncbi:MAG TPA: hypothetical protein ENH82_14155 [bacterium]|nr:hypothetical protein [bacterium]